MTNKQWNSCCNGLLTLYTDRRIEIEQRNDNTLNNKNLVWWVQNKHIKPKGDRTWVIQASVMDI